MSNYHTVPEGKDPHLWQIAQRRAGFKRHLAVYIAVNLFFWALWIFSNDQDHHGLPWPVYPGIGWGIGLFFNYLGAYSPREEDNVEKEYNKLINRK